MNEALEYYVYGLIDPRSNEIFYIGKGKGKRAEQHFKEILQKGAGNHAKIKLIEEIEKNGFKAELQYLLKDINEEAAYFLEEILIDRIGRRILNYGTLTNITVGGKHDNKLKFSLETAEKTSIHTAISKYPLLKTVIENIPRTSKEDEIKERFSQVVNEVSSLLLEMEPNIFNLVEAEDIKFLDHPGGKAIQFQSKYGNCEILLDVSKEKFGVNIRKDRQTIFSTKYGVQLSEMVLELKAYIKATANTTYD